MLSVLSKRLASTWKTGEEMSEARLISVTLPEQSHGISAGLSFQAIHQPIDLDIGPGRGSDAHDLIGKGSAVLILQVERGDIGIEIKAIAVILLVDRALLPQS